MDESHKINDEPKKPGAKIYSIWLHVYEVQNQVHLIYNVISQDNSYSGGWGGQ